MSEGAPEVVRPPAPAPFEFLRTKARAASSSVTVNNTGVLSIIPGAGVTVDHPTGDVTVSATGGGGGTPTLWNGVAYLTADFTVSGTVPVAVGPTILLNTAGMYLVCLTAAAPRCIFWAQYQEDPLSPANALVSGTGGPANDGTAGSLGLSKVVFANSNGKVLIMVGSMAGIGGTALVTANAPFGSGAPNASGISAVQLSQVS